MYFSIIFLASSTGSSIGVEVVPSFPLEPRSLLNARYAKYESPMVANIKKAVERNALSTKRVTLKATIVTEILAIGLGTELGTRLVPASIPSLPTFHTFSRTFKKFDCAAKTTKLERGFWVLELLKRVFERKGCVFNFKRELGE